MLQQQLVHAKQSRHEPGRQAAEDSWKTGTSRVWDQMSWELIKENVQPLKQGRQLDEGGSPGEGPEDAKAMEQERRQAAVARLPKALRLPCQGLQTAKTPHSEHAVRSCSCPAGAL